MFPEDKITIEKDGKNIDCEILFDFTCDENKKQYVAFTDHSTDEEGNENVYVKTFENKGKEIVTNDIETDAEWEMVSEVLNAIKNGEV